MDLLEAYQYAERKDIEVIDFKMEEMISFSVPNAVVMDKRKIQDSADEKVRLIHEIGHCETSTFYNVATPLQTRARLEYRANKWAFRKIINKKDLVHAMKIKHLTLLWELAEYFEVTEDFMQKAIDFYKYSD